MFVLQFFYHLVHILVFCGLLLPAWSDVEQTQPIWHLVLLEVLVQIHSILKTLGRSLFCNEIAEMKLLYLRMMSNSLGIPVITVNQPKVKDKPAK